MTTETLHHDNALKQRERLLQVLDKIRYKIAIVSGKGGVGKTTIAVNLAALLASKGYRVGILDANIDCPNVHMAFGVKERLEKGGGIIIPAEKDWVRIVSMAGIYEKEDQALIWRGQMIAKMISEFIVNTDWGKLDYLIIDTPPGTSDAISAVIKLLGLDGMIVVTTPQALGLVEAKKAIRIGREMNVPILGIIENMSSGAFGRGGGEKTAKETGIKFLGSIDLDAKISELTDSGKPAVFEVPQMRAEFDKILKKLNFAMPV